ncbi:MAG: helix-hairpin-helix domain-containing protein [Caldanaerobacter sp.]
MYRNSQLKADFIVDTSQSELTAEKASEHEPIEIKVYVTGEVKNPGVYIMKEGERVIDAIEKAGGVLEEADLSNINLAQKVKDEQMIKVFKKGEKIENSPLYVNSYSNSKKVNINTATKEELQTLPGIGPVTADRIIEFREAKGPFKKIEDIMNVPRIGPKMFEQIKDKITVD